MEFKDIEAVSSVGYFNNKQRKHDVRYKLNQGVLKIALQESMSIFKQMLSASQKAGEKITCFISHADDGGDNTQWVKWLAKALEKANCEVLLGVLQAKCGQDTTALTEKIMHNDIDYIIMIGTPLYVERYKNKNSDELVGLEIRLLNQMMLNHQRSNRIIPILLEGTSETSFPPFARIKIYADFCKREYNFSLTFDLVCQMHETIIKEKLQLSDTEFKNAHEKYKLAKESLVNSLEIVRGKELQQAQNQYLAKVVSQSQKLTQTNERHINTILEKQLLLDTDFTDEEDSLANKLPSNIDAVDIQAIMNFVEFDELNGANLTDKLDNLQKGLEVISKKYDNNVEVLLGLYNLALAYRKSGIKVPSQESVQNAISSYKKMMNSNRNKKIDSNSMMVAVRQQACVETDKQALVSQYSIPKTHNYNLPERNREFSGRDQELKELLNYVNNNYLAHSNSSQKILVLSGLGGIGKTQLTIEMVHQLLGYPTGLYSLVGWLDAEQGLNEQYRLLMEKYGVKLTDKSINSYKTKYEDLLNQVNGPLLLILDNVKDYDEIRNFLPDHNRVNIIIITQSQIWNAQQFHLFSVGSFSEQEALECITKRLTDVTKEQAQTLAKTLHYFPLALYQAISYLEQTCSDIENYLTEYHHQKKLFLNTTVETGTPKATVYSTLRMAISRVEDKLRLLKGSQQETIDKLFPMLKVCAYLNSSDILRKILSKLMTDIQLNQILLALNAYSLVKISKDKQAFSFHPLVQEVIRAEIESENEGPATWVQLTFRLINASIQFNYDHPENWGLENKLLTHAKTVKMYANYYKVPLEQGELLKQESFNLKEASTDKEDIITKLKNALAFEKQNNNGPARITTLNCDLGDVLRAQGRFHEAIEYYHSALTLMHSTLRLSNEEIGCLHLKLAHAYRESGDYELARDELETALKLFKDCYNTNHPHIGLVHNYLGLIAHASGDYSVAIAHYEEALPSLQRHFGECHPALARPINGSGLALSHKGQHRNAIFLFTKALAFYEEYSLFKNAQLETGIINLNLASSYMYCGSYIKAKFHCSQAVRSLAENPKVVFAYFVASRIYEQLNQYSTALEYLNQALILGKKYFGINLSKIMSNVSNPSVIWQPLKRDETEDIYHYKEILENIIQMFTEKHREVVYTLNKLGMLYQNNMEYEQAHECFTKALQLCEEIGPKNINSQNLQLIKNNIEFSVTEKQNAAIIKRQRL